MTNKNLDIAIETWRFFVEAHPDADMEAVVKHIAEETRKLTLGEISKEAHRMDGSTYLIPDYHKFRQAIEALEQGCQNDNQLSKL